MLCELCYLEDVGTVPCVKCGRYVCVYCSLPGIPVDLDDSLLTERTPDAVWSVCSDCNPPAGGRASRLRAPGPLPGYGLRYDPHRVMETAQLC